MPAKRKVPAKRKSQTGKGMINSHYRSLGLPHGYEIQHPQYGTGLWDSIKNAFNWVKDNKIISTVASLIPHPAGQAVGNIAGQLGFGRRVIHRRAIRV
ncbi:MAG: hypothetical protein P4L41_10960 [Flavipsychrobacter sp.]|nr:hypothetical protein [Flavipsychrobacter sp.]